jgi:hypothetical protein
MREGADKEKPLLGQTIECVGMMYRSLQSLYENEYPRDPQMFAIMAQGPVDQIRDLLDDIELLMKDMIPPELRRQAAQLEESDGTEAVGTRKAA